MSINADLRDKMLELFEQHMPCWPDDMDQCTAGSDFMDAVNDWIHQ